MDLDRLKLKKIHSPEQAAQGQDQGQGSADPWASSEELAAAVRDLQSSAAEFGKLLARLVDQLCVQGGEIALLRLRVAQLEDSQGGQAAAIPELPRPVESKLPSGWNLIRTGGGDNNNGESGA